MQARRHAEVGSSGIAMCVEDGKRAEGCGSVAHQHRPIRALQDVPGDTAENPLRESAVAVRAHDQQVGLFPVRRIQQSRTGLAPAVPDIAQFDHLRIRYVPLQPILQTEGRPQLRRLPASGLDHEQSCERCRQTAIHRGTPGLAHCITLPAAT